MKISMLVGGLATMMFSGCLMAPYPPNETVMMAPALPSVVWLDTSPYYVNNGYTYYYHNNGWQYSQHRRGPWVELPRDRCPKEVRYKDRYNVQHHEQEHDQDHNRRR
jgi:hypothetical protein